jgi:hypothetical protein
MKALVIAAVLLASCSPVSSAPTATPTPSTAVVPPAASPSPTPSPTPSATVATGLTRFTNTELGYSLDLPSGWRRATCSLGVLTTSPLEASEFFIAQPETEETINIGVPLATVRVVQAEGLTPLAWLQRNASQPDTRFEPVTFGGRTGARGYFGATGDTYAFAFDARGWIYAIEASYFGAADPELDRILKTLRVLDVATLGQTASSTPAPRTIESLVDAVADGFARRDLTAIADTLEPCVTIGAIPGGAARRSRSAYVTALGVEFAAGTSVQVRPRPIEDDPSFGRFVRTTWSKPGQPDQRVDVFLRARSDRWAVTAILIRAPGY